MIVAKTIRLLAAVTALFLTSCVGVLSVRPSMNNATLLSVQPQDSLKSSYQLALHVPDTLLLSFLNRAGEPIGSGSKWVHNIKPAYSQMVEEYMQQKYSGIVSGDTVQVSCTIDEYRITSRDISKKGEKFMAVALGVADLRSEYKVSLRCRVKAMYQGKAYEKTFTVRETSQQLTKMRQSTTYGSNGTSYSTGYSSSNTTTTDALIETMNIAHEKSIVLMDGFLSRIGG